MNFMFLPDVTKIPLNPRPGYAAMIVAGKPEAFGRVVSMSDDRKTARVVWRGTPGTYRFQPDPISVDVGYIVCGKVIIHPAGRPDLEPAPGSLIEFPRETFDMEIIETFIKVSFLSNPNGLKVRVEPLP